MKDAILKWFITGQIGASSKAMACCFAGLPVRGDHPYDPADLNRCLLFLDKVPEARKHMDKLRELSPVWDALVDHWDELEKTFINEVGMNWTKARSAPKTYQLMKDIGC